MLTRVWSCFLRSFSSYHCVVCGAEGLCDYSLYEPACMQTHSSHCNPVCSCLLFISALLSWTCTVAGVVLRLSCRGNGWTTSLITLHPLTFIYIYEHNHTEIQTFIITGFCSPAHVILAVVFHWSCFSPLQLQRHRFQVCLEKKAKLLASKWSKNYWKLLQCMSN